MHTIKEVSEITGVSKVALRYYDKIGILKTKRLENGYRVYDDSDIYILQHVQVLKYAGFTLEDIKVLISLYSLEDGENCNALATNVISSNLKSIHSQISFLKQVADVLESIYPLFQTHELYRINQKELQTIILKLFHEVKENKQKGAKE